MRVRIDRELCTGVGNCIAVAPTVFDLDEKSKAVVLDANAADDETLMTAASSCPQQAVILEDDRGNQIYP